MNSSQSTKLESEIRRLKRAVEELTILNEIAAAINSSMELDKIVELIIKKCVKHLKVEQAAVMLLDKSEEENAFRTMIRQADSKINTLPCRLDTQLTGFMLKNRKPLLINNFKNDNRFNYTDQESFPIQSLLAVPLLSKGLLIGLLATFNKRDTEGFSNGDQRLLSIIAAQSAQVIENARLLEEEQTLLKIEKEMEMAQEIQINLLPRKTPQLVDYDIAGTSIPAQAVGGDYFDFIRLDDCRLAFCLGDVSGKGLPAALLMANLQATIRAQTSLNPAPYLCLQNSNIFLYQCTTSQKFATLFYGILDINTHQFSFANAGHNRPYFFKGEEQPKCLETAGLALSFLEKVSYKEDIITFKPGYLLVIYSDGITEAMNMDNEEFGEERLTSLVKENSGQSANQLLNTIIESVQKFAGNKPQIDDMTVVIIKRV